MKTEAEKQAFLDRYVAWCLEQPDVQQRIFNLAFVHLLTSAVPVQEPCPAVDDVYEKLVK